MKVIIVGGVAGGASAAARIRRLDENAEILVFERSGYVSYANCGLPYYIGGVITDREKLTLQTPESFYKRFQIQVKVHHEVTALHPERKTVTVKNLETGEEFEESYDKLLLSPGAKPSLPKLSGIASERIFSLRTVEMAENLQKIGISVTMLQRPKQVLPPLDGDMASQLHGVLRSKGIQLKLGSSVAGFQTEGDTVVTFLGNEKPLKSQMVILAIGVTPETTLAREAGLELGIKGSIVVNERMETSEPDIYAVGDAVQVKHRVTGQQAVISLAGPANKQGRIAGDNICGGNSVYRGSQGSSVIKLFDITAAATGINEKAAREAGIEYDKVVLSPVSHASYYPGGKAMTMKVIFEKKSLKILGAQIVGYEGVDKRIDVLATAIYAGLKATDLKDLDLAYAPPYSSAKDPVNMAGFMIENLAEGRVKQFHWDQVEELPRDGSVILLDTRTPGEYERGHAEGFVNIPVDELRDRLRELEKGKPVYVMCQSGLRSYIASRILVQNGWECYNFSGGYRFYQMVTEDRIAGVTCYSCGIEK